MHITKKPISQGLLCFVELCGITIWWRRGESNPRPGIFHDNVYMRISRFRVSLSQPPGSGMLFESQLRFGFAAHTLSTRARLSCFSRRPSNPCRMGTCRTLAVIKRLGRNYNRLRLCFFLPFLRVCRNLGMRPALQLPPSNPFRPLSLAFGECSVYMKRIVLCFEYSTYSKQIKQRTALTF